ncbi:hypothetical protein BX666DRAFT_1299520 [Dichotomocladium elegans]|nr:hypothetical protein BX666DRAFT_1299520 [Dichotomocladium elegans]
MSFVHIKNSNNNRLCRFPYRSTALMRCWKVFGWRKGPQDRGPSTSSFSSTVFYITLMITDEREETLREVCALGNLKAVQHFAKSGVNLNSQNKMNGWSALHWASHRGHEKVVRLLLSNGANPNLKTNKNQTALDLATPKYPAIGELLRAVTTDVQPAGPEPELPIVPTYLKEPDLEKSWLLPDEFSETKIENMIRQHEANVAATNVPAPAPAPAPASVPISEEREILVYLNTRSDESILGSVFLKNESIEASISTIKAVRQTGVRKPMLGDYLLFARNLMDFPRNSVWLATMGK